MPFLQKGQSCLSWSTWCMGESASDAKKELFPVKEQDTHIVGVGYKKKYIYIYMWIYVYLYASKFLCIHAYSDIFWYTYKWTYIEVVIFLFFSPWTAPGSAISF